MAENCNIEIKGVCTGEHALEQYEKGELQFCLICAHYQLKRAHRNRRDEAIKFKNKLFSILDEYYEKRAQCCFLSDRHIGEFLLKLHNLIIELDNAELSASMLNVK